MPDVTPLGPGAWREERKKITELVKKDSVLPNFTDVKAQNIHTESPAKAEQSYMIQYIVKQNEFYFMSVWILPACMVKHCVCDRCLWRPEERVGFPGLGLQVLVSGHLRAEPPVLLTRESALQPLSCVSCCQGRESVEGWGSSLSWFPELGPICSVIFDCFQGCFSFLLLTWGLLKRQLLVS